VQKRIKKYYRRDSEVIYPPVETNKFYISKDIDKYFDKFLKYRITNEE
jgi:hypothetical protein